MWYVWLRIFRPVDITSPKTSEIDRQCINSLIVEFRGDLFQQFFYSYVQAQEEGKIFGKKRDKEENTEKSYTRSKLKNIT